MSTFVVTAANRGLGLELARQLKERGDEVVATARRPDAAERLAGLDVEVHRLDVGDDESVRSFAAELRGRPVDVLINNAGIGVRSKGLESVETEEMMRFFEVNTLGALRVTRGLLDNLRAGEAKKVVNITSRMGSIADNGSGGAYEYRASKAALNMVTRSMAIDYADLTCIVLHPGWVKTDMGGFGARLEVDESVAAMLRVIDGLGVGDSGSFLDYRGEVVPW